MPRIKVTTVFKFDELSDKAKEKARDWYREGGLGYDWWDTVYEGADTAASHLGIDIDRKGKRTPAIYFSGFWNQGDGASFEGEYRYKKGWRKALLAEFGPGESLDKLLSIGQALQQAQAPHLYKLTANCKVRGHYVHSGCMGVEVTHADDWYRDIGDAEDAVRDALREFADWIYDRLEKEHDWLTSDECIDDAIKANEYEFTEEGEPA